MKERISTTAHGDAPLTAAHHPDATAAGLLAAKENDELSGRTVTINRPLQELVGYWRDGSNLPLLFGEGEMGTVTIEQDAGQATGEQALTLSSPPGEQRRFNGRIGFRPAPAGRGTEVTLTLAMEARNLISKTVDKLKHRDPAMEGRAVLRRFKQLMETGEIATARPPHAAPRA